MAFSESVFNFIKDYIDAKVQTAIKQALAQDGNSTIEIKEYEVKSYGEPVYVKIPTYVTPSGISSQFFNGYNQNEQSSGFVFTGSDGNLYSYVVPDGAQVLTTEDGKPYFVNGEGQIIYILLPNNTTGGSNIVSGGSTGGTTDEGNGTITGGNGGEISPECAKYFENINIAARDIALPGYTIEYMPSEPIKKDTEYTYTVHAIVTHDESGCTKTSSFEETTYPDGVQIDKYGRTVIQYNEAEPTNCVDRAILRYARKNAVLLVKPKETEADKAVADLYKTVLKRTLIDSEGMEYWVGEYNSGKYTIDELKRRIALGTPNIKGLEEASYFARAYLYSIGEEGYDAGGRYVLDICEVPDSPCRKAILIPELKNVFVDGNGSEEDNMIENAYKEVLDRDYVDARGFVAWRKALEDNGWTYDQLKESIASSALEELDSGRCTPNIYDAYIYLHPHDKNGRKYIKMTRVPQTECWKYAISQKNPERFNFVESNGNDDIDKSIAQAYKQVLGRDYIESQSIQNWYEYVKDNEPTFSQLCQAIAQAAKESTADCPETKEKAKQWLQNGTFDVFGDGSAVAFYQFEGNANDTGGMYNGEWHGNEQYDEGVFGKAAKFDGNGHIKIETLNNPFKNDFTVSFWFKSIEKANSGNSDSILAGNVDYKFGLSTREYGDSSNCEVRWIIGNGSEWLEWFGPEEDHCLDNTSKWYFITVTKQGQNYKFYKNSELWFEHNTTHSEYSGDSTVKMGIWGDDKYYETNCLIDQVRIFNRALTEDEVKQLYHVGKPIYKKSTINKLDVFDDNSCIATYTFDDKTANDLSENYNGTWNGTEQYGSGIKGGMAADMINAPTSTYIKTPIIDRQGSKEITISGWIKVPEHSGSWINIWHLTPDDENLDVNSRQPALWLYENDNTKFHIANDGVNTGDIGIDSSNGSITYNKWYFITQVVTSRQMKFYINGELTDTYNSSEDFKFNNGYFYIGDKWYKKNHYIDQVRIFNKALTADEVQKLYEEGRD